MVLGKHERKKIREEELRVKPENVMEVIGIVNSARQHTALFQGLKTER